MNSKFLKYTTLVLACISMCSCKDDSGESSIDDYFLNYEIKQIDVTTDIQVGAFLRNPFDNLNNEDFWGRLTEERNDAAGQVGPSVRPVLGQYGIGVDTLGARSFQQIIDWGVEARIDYFVLPVTSEDRTKMYPRNILSSDSAFINMVQMRNDTLGTNIDLKGVKFALMVNMDGFANDLNNNTLLENHAPSVIWVEEDLMSYEISREQQLYDYYKRISDYFSDPNYYHLNGCPVVVIRTPERLYSENSEKVYENIRKTVKEHSGKDIYLIAQQDKWAPPARFHYFHLSGKVDAITIRNMCDVTLWDRTTMLPQYINENLKYNREYVSKTYGIDFIPPVSTGYNYYPLNPAAYNVPRIDKSEKLFTDFCNVAKMNLGNAPMILIDAFNDWSTDSAIEPTEEGYGRGYGNTYLNIVRKQFKR